MFFFTLIAVLAATATFLGCTFAAPAPQGPTPLRPGFHTTWATSNSTMAYSPTHHSLVTGMTPSYTLPTGHPTWSLPHPHHLTSLSCVHRTTPPTSNSSTPTSVMSTHHYSNLTGVLSSFITTTTTRT